MLFNSISFIVFFIAFFCIYMIVPKKTRLFLLLAASYYFYMQWNAKYLILILADTIITYGTGVLLQKKNISTSAKKFITGSAIVFVFAILGVFKYYNFFMDSINHIIKFRNEYHINILLPVGISFYSFQAVSYVIDVYRGEVEAEKNFFVYSLFISFFPQLVAGPIERTKNLLTQIRKLDKINLHNAQRIEEGVMLMAWGYFQKIMIADRISPLVNNVYTNYSLYGMVEIFVATVLFAFQIYCDFDGYTNIARGAAKFLGIELMVNFKQPYLASNIKDFWRRWHISLTSWFTDYLYIPLGGNRKGKLRTQINTMIVFLVSGLWHGASWNFVFWGFLHGVYQVVYSIFFGKKKKNPQNIISYTISAGVTFLFTCFAWLFFAADSMQHALAIINQALHNYHLESLTSLGINRINWYILFLCVFLLMCKDYLVEKKENNLFDFVKKIPVFVRFMLYSLWGLWIVFMGIYGTAYDASQFIYFQF